MGSEQHNDPLFSRGETTGELRGDCPKSVLAVLDAVSMARGMNSRMPLVNEILSEWAKNKVHEASLITRLTRDYPQPPEASGKGAE